MPHPRPSLGSTSNDTAGSFGAEQPPADVRCAPAPLPTQEFDSPALYKSPTRTSTMNAPVNHLESFHDHQVTAIPMTVGKADEMQWRIGADYPFETNNQDFTDYVEYPLARLPGHHYHQQFRDRSSFRYHYDAPYPQQYGGIALQHWYEAVKLPEMSDLTNAPNSHPPAAYQIEPQMHIDTTRFSEFATDDSLMQVNDNYEHHYDDRSWLDVQSRYQGTYSDMTRASTPYATTPDCSLVYDNNDSSQQDKEQPYAQLIYKALKQAPGHTMILREIYDWFKTNTDKSTGSETKGWQNSIRHNLSMNGAFEKVDQPGEDSRKGYLWRLTDKALREGVRSTTRYRTKQLSKRSYRRQHPQPQRQASGAKGGQASGRLAKSRRNKRSLEHYTSEAQPSLSMPAAFTQPYNAGFPCVPSPYYDSETSFSYSVKDEPDEYGSPLASILSRNIFSTGLSYDDSTSQLGPILESAYELGQYPGDSLFNESNSPSPPASEPLTPPSPIGGWGVDQTLGSPSIIPNKMYREYSSVKIE